MKSLIIHATNILFNPRRAAQDRLVEAVKKRARCEAESNFYWVMSQYHLEQAEKIDPHTDWWGYAEQREEASQHDLSHILWTKRAKQAQDVVVRATERLKTLRG